MACQHLTETLTRWMIVWTFLTLNHSEFKVTHTMQVHLSSCSRLSVNSMVWNSWVVSTNAPMQPGYDAKAATEQHRSVDIDHSSSSIPIFPFLLFPACMKHEGWEVVFRRNGTGAGAADEDGDHGQDKAGCIGWANLVLGWKRQHRGQWRCRSGENICWIGGNNKASADVNPHWNRHKHRQTHWLANLVGGRRCCLRVRRWTLQVWVYNTQPYKALRTRKMHWRKWSESVSAGVRLRRWGFALRATADIHYAWPLDSEANSQ